MAERVPADPQSAFLEDVNQNIGIVHRVCHVYFSRNATERDDVFQDIMYQLWKAYPTFKGQSKFSTWMHQVALNTAIGHVRRTSRTSRLAELPAEPVAQTPDMHERIDRDTQLRHVYEAIDTLTAVDKAIILLHLEDHGYDDIAAITGLTRANVSVRLVRIKQALKGCLQHAQ